MASLNKVFLIGNLTRDPELRYIPNGTAVAKFGLAVNRTYKSQDGELKDEPCFVDIVTWGKIAETCANYLSKGRSIFVEGHLQFNSWETPDGQKRSKIDVVAERIQFLGSAKSAEGPAEAEGIEDIEADDDIPF